ncbi:DUF6882 domain-containing protein [Cerasicoccus fimbriatus]|uniref:DUF6882 domain-containing protein n=1 Tax=Cerasicoccus fimbriatus TaxID=3014554 RepID=UPI0022B4B23F|nr:DUF6882 domain-containing protein [Cerasicoccus sp. TK19100]
MSLFKNIFGKKVADQITPKRDREYNEYLVERVKEVEELNSNLSQQYGLGSYERWDIDQEVGDLLFSNAGEVQLSCKVVILGSYSSVSETWMWGWANPSLLDHLTKDTERLIEYGEQHNISDLTEPKTEATEDEAWALSAFACRILGGRGLYRGPTGNGFIIMMITELTKANKTR